MNNPTRRLFISSLGAAATTPLLGSTSVAHSLLHQGSKFHRPLAISANTLAYFKRIIAKNDYTIFADCDHADALILYQFFSDERVQNACKEAGAGSLTLEEENDLQFAADNFAAHKPGWSEGDFIDFMTYNECAVNLGAEDSRREHMLLARIIKGNALLNIKTLFTDHDDIGPQAERLESKLELMRKKYLTAHKLAITPLADVCATNSLVSPDYEKLFPKTAEQDEESIERFRASIGDNRHVIEMTEALNRNRMTKRLICYGEGHALALQWILANEWRKTSAVIAIHSCREHYKVNLAEMIKEQGRETVRTYSHYIIADDLIVPPAVPLSRPARSIQISQIPLS